MTPKNPRNRGPRNYPVLSFQRTKEPWDDKRTLTSSPVLYNRRLSSQRTYLPTGSKTTWIEVNQVVSAGVSNSRTFQRNKDWKAIIAKGGDATYPYTATYCTVKPSRYNGTTTGWDYLSSSYGSIIGTQLVDVKDNTVLRDQAVGRLKHKLNGYVGKAQLMAPIAESREIHRIVRQINGLAIDTVKTVAALRKTKGKSALKHFGDIWLGFGFGIRPMLSDIESAANSVLDYTMRQDRQVRVTGKANRDWHSGNTSSFQNIAYGTDIQLNNSANHWQGVSIVAGIDLQVRSAASYTVERHLGLDISSIPGTIWELIPFSWVLDYAATVGPWLDDMFYTLPGVCKYVSQTAKYKIETFSFPEIINQTGFKFAGGLQTGVFKQTSIVRTSLASLPSRQLRLRTVDEVAKYGVTKVLNLASVLAGRASPQLQRPRQRRVAGGLNVTHSY